MRDTVLALKITVQDYQNYFTCLGHHYVILTNGGVCIPTKELSKEQIDLIHKAGFPYYSLTNYEYLIYTPNEN